MKDVINLLRAECLLQNQFSLKTPVSVVGGVKFDERRDQFCFGVECLLENLNEVVGVM